MSYILYNSTEDKEGCRLPTLEEMNRLTHRVPGRNQRKDRKARRQRHANGDRKAFK